MDLSEVCNLCNEPNDQMLMLKCVHDPCINCAASTYAQQIHIKGQSNQIYVCQICGQQTVLDGTTVKQLTNLANSFVKSPSKNYVKRNFPRNTSNPNKKSDGTTTTQPPSTKKVIYYCKDHNQEQVTYYCFNCWQNICPQCAIHGNHKDHKVKMIKKAISQVKNDYVQKMGKINTYQNSVEKGRQEFLRITRSSNERYVRQRHIISKQFEAMRTSLTVKQKELLKELDDINRHNDQTLTSIIEQLNKNYEQSNKLKKNVEAILKKDQVLILQQYRKISSIQNQILQISKKTDTIGGRINALNGQNLVEQVKQLGQNIKRIKLKLDQEKIGLNESMGHTTNNEIKDRNGRQT